MDHVTRSLLEHAAPQAPPRELRELEQEERALSRRRRRLHETITFVRGGGRGSGPEAEETLFQLEREELELSATRRQLHDRIDELRIQAGLQPGPTPVAGDRPRLGP